MFLVLVLGWYSLMLVSREYIPSLNDTISIEILSKVIHFD